MQNKTVEEIAELLTDYLIKYFGDKLEDFEIFNLQDEPYKTFSIRFQAYKYFIILLNCDRGRFGCSIQFGETNYIPLENSQKWIEKADLEVFFKEFKEQIEIRIPDKFLQAKGWK